MKKILLATGIISLLIACKDTQNNKVNSSGNSKDNIAFNLDAASASVYTTDSVKNKLALTDSALKFAEHGQPIESQVYVFVDPNHQYQTLLGIGGALTDASAETFYKLPKDKQAQILKAYFDPKDGIGYTLGRTNINSCDFSSDMYTYTADNDTTLKSFSLAHDEKYKIPFIKEAIAAAGGKLTMFASPWSPPAWMKDNNDMLQGGKLKKEHYQNWANYMARFVKEFESKGIPLWGVTVQNEPMAKQTWESCIYTAEEEAEYVKNNLGPTFKKEGLGEKKIVIWDHNRDLIMQRATQTLKDPEVSKYVWGIGFHWYEDWSGGVQQFNNVAKVQEAFPDKNLLFTEGCNGPFNFDKMYGWKWGERYGESMINDFNNGTVGWTDWNILLDETGGPNHVKNFCYAPIIGDTKTGDVHLTPEYYYIGHFSKYIKPGAKRVLATPSRSDLLATAFINTDGKIAVVVMNKTGKEIPYHLWIANKAIDIKAPARSIATIVL